MNGPVGTLVWLCLYLCLFAAPAAGQSGGSSSGAAQGGGSQSSKIAYTVEFQGSMDSELETLVKSVSQLVALEDREPPTRPALERRIEQDRQLIADALNSRGYYDPTIDWKIVDGTPLNVVVTVDPGRLFTIGTFAVDFPQGANVQDLPQPSLEQLGIKIGDPALASTVVTAEKRLVDYMQNNGYPFAAAGQRYITVDLDTAEMAVTLRAVPGERATFGPLAIEGLDRLEEPYLRRVLRWPEGELYSAARRETIRRRAVAVGVFDGVDLTMASAVQPDGSLPGTLKLTEGPRRTVSAGVAYTTEYGDAVGGFSADFSWEHNNFFGEAEKLRFEGHFATLEQSAAAIYTKPNWIDLNQKLIISAEVKNEDIDAYKQLSGVLFGGVERPLTKSLTLAVGVAAEVLRVNSKDSGSDSGPKNFVLFSLPTVLKWDRRDDIFNPTKGYFLSLGVTPTMATWADTTFYSLVDLGASTYYAPFSDDSVVLAVRGRVASLAGGDLDRVPASKLLYAGGGGSVRGYKLDSLGPLDSDDDALGGLSLFEASVEARFRFLEDYGIVLFLDAGQVYEDNLPKFTNPQFGAGIGLRYFTSFGPLRVDFAFPLNPRPSDPFFQFYVSIGQSF